MSSQEPLLDGLTPEDGIEFSKKHQLPQLLAHNPLSNPKGMHYNCEICSRESHLQCSLCKRTFYCCAEDQEMDWKSVHSKICPYIAALRAPPPVLSTQEQRSQRAETVIRTKKHVLEICKQEAYRHLIENDPQLAHPACIQALRYASEVYGKNAIELVPPYLLLTEANIAAKYFDKAEENLCQAKWILIQYPKADPSLKSQLSRNFGKLYTSKLQYDKALKHFASDVYFTALQKGPDHIETSVGFYFMGNVFIDKHDNKSAVAIFDKVLTIWTPFLQQCIAPVFNGGQITTPPDFTETNSKLASQIMKKIRSALIEILGPTQIAVAQAIFAHGLLKCVLGEWKDAFRLLAQASQMFEVTAGSEHTLTRESHRYLQLAQKKKKEETMAEDDDDETHFE
ncbi:MYND finger family protein [Trichomonas vaginalis G3]|uniref:MYND finger family protein n=1 Tax=Trichomonas vaginalis (strain ATCC PRA-98 / G3) TaxID=412133 RepID=A2E1S4_TRIV3|nr:zinc finger MYND domain-containing protein 12 family [Trichomonas vaginalis G3]EAY13403.1 MYND finger family protein [Trichomonas vaginalis G3]KAI5528155.1 zinc finger MYND domain-containing protein 12 family [Trichomonas vaginalis G3]|eukprot:XP_001325626.1 MYND finger family protein [Trichomonas vaginalis G3]